MIEINQLCEYLDWDSSFFGYNIARVSVNQLTQETIEPILNWCHIHHIDCLYLLANADDRDTVRLAEDNNFRFMDIRVTLDRCLDKASSSDYKPISGLIRPFVVEDIPALRSIATVCYHNTRFYFDPNFPEYLCNALYETWIEKSCNGYADMVLVAELQEQVVGYISCHILDKKRGQIGLVGVCTNSQGKGIGQGLVNASLQWFRERDVKQISVVTQGRNCNAQRLYQKCSFMTRSMKLWYHQWFQLAENNL
jgi:dTDP-4-amino-4,6-dideoxy-D-galactose acyltransferase